MTRRPQLPNQLLFSVLFWLLASFLLAGINQSFVNSYGQAWMLATMLLPGALFGKWIADYLFRKYPKRVHYWIYGLIGVLYLEYVGAFAAYWLIFQWQPMAFPKVLINPVFSLFWIAALVLGEHALWNGAVSKLYPPEQEDSPQVETPSDTTASQMVELVSNRKRSTWQENDLLYIESLDSFTQVHTCDGQTLPTNKRISHWEQELPSWVRIHRSYLVNPSHAKAMGRAEVGIFSRDEERFLPIGRSYKERALEELS